MNRENGLPKPPLECPLKAYLLEMRKELRNTSAHTVLISSTNVRHSWPSRNRWRYEYYV